MKVMYTKLKKNDGRIGVTYMFGGIYYKADKKKWIRIIKDIY